MADKVDKVELTFKYPLLDGGPRDTLTWGLSIGAGDNDFGLRWNKTDGFSGNASHKRGDGDVVDFQFAKGMSTFGYLHPSGDGTTKRLEIDTISGHWKLINRQTIGNWSIWESIGSGGLVVGGESGDMQPVPIWAMTQ